MLYRIENGRIRPSKSLQDALAGMLKGNREFLMIDEQKLVYETALHMAQESHKDGRKRVFVVKGGPGTGKSVLAVNLLVQLSRKDMVCHYVTKNQAPRSVYAVKLKGSMTKASVDNLFKGSGVYVESPANEVDVILADEAHRLNEKSGLYANEGENQVMEIIRAARFPVFFIDERQRIHVRDIGSIRLIRDFAEAMDAEVIEMELASQFRCNGSDGYLAWVDDVLGVRETANADDFELAYDLRILDDPHELRRLIFEKNRENASNRSRILAGYCWEWEKAGRGNPDAMDIRIPEHEFAMSWNMDSTSTWAIDPESVREAGCIHTSQGLEFDYVGVIIGPDLRHENGRIVTDGTKRASTDASLKGFKTLMKKDPQQAMKVADEIIRNTYRTLMTRGQKGCFVYCVDKALGAYFRERLQAVRTRERETGVNYGEWSAGELRGKAAEDV